MKLHEATIVIRSDDINGGDCRLYLDSGAEIADIPGLIPGGADRWARFFQAAPAMAQALLATGTRSSAKAGWHTHSCDEYGSREKCTEDCETARAVFVAAGVLPAVL